jgi:hypothetical protein
MKYNNLDDLIKAWMENGEWTITVVNLDSTPQPYRVTDNCHEQQPAGI